MAGMVPDKRVGAELQDGHSDAKRLRLDERPDAGPGEIRIPQQFVGWLKGKGGAQIREVEARSGAQVSIDQTTKELGYSRVMLAGSAEAVQAAHDIITDELRRVMERDGIAGRVTAAPGPGDEVAETHIPQKYVGWLKGSNGSQIRDMEAKTGARVRIDQSTRESGYSVAQITGPPDAVRQCKAFVEAEVVRVQERDRVVAEHAQQPSAMGSNGFNEVQIPQQYVGWIKGSGGSQIKDIEARTGAHITVDQSTQDLGYSRAMVYGPDEAVVAAKQVIQSELARVMERDGATPGPAGAALATAQPGDPAKDALTLLTTLLAAASAAGGNTAAQNTVLADALGLLAAAGTAGAPASAPAVSAVPLEPGDTGEWDTVQIPNSCVGWLKGRQGAMIREIESRSGAQVDIDQTTKDLGYSTAHMRGRLQQKKTAHGLVVAEVMKVMDQSGEPSVSQFPGAKSEFRIDVQYVGWVKGPRGKVVQEIQVKSGTRIDVDQNTRDLGYAMVKVYGTHEGVRYARSLIAQELSKITPEVAASLADDGPAGLGFAQQTGHHSHAQQQVAQRSLQPHAAAAAPLGQYGYDLQGLAGSQSAPPSGALQQQVGTLQAAAAALQLISSLQQLASVVSQAAPR
uniref:K Homology domain-containing protein n=1 Tax=Alexandrium monilatum TaxID=311494 RepID=A0A7S4R5U7_9DINO|mmetsp:Transcript_10165/g.30502  ORF Transcript_10165/g.30502 Transcript_10165/m.30502 type:complete len:627 (+) Transcript_10165:151-2031(+)